MVRSHKIRVFFLTVVYFSLLTALFLPHHHHEEAACYTTTHCEEDASGHNSDAKDQVDHSHDHNTSDETQRCLNTEYFVFSDTGKNIKRVFEFEIPALANHHFLSSCMLCAEDEQEIQSIFKLFGQLSVQNKFTVFVKHQLPQRAPPISIA